MRRGGAEPEPPPVVVPASGASAARAPREAPRLFYSPADITSCPAAIGCRRARARAMCSGLGGAEGRGAAARPGRSAPRPGPAPVALPPPARGAARARAVPEGRQRYTLGQLRLPPGDSRRQAGPWSDRAAPGDSASSAGEVRGQKFVYTPKS